MNTSWPGDTPTVVSWVRDALFRVSDDGEISVSGLDRIKVSAELDGTDLQHLRLDATGVKLRIHVNDVAGTQEAAAESEAAEPEPVLRETGIAKNFRILAHPMHIERTPVTFDVRAFDIPIVWSTFAEPTVADAPASIHSLMPAEDLKGVHGTFDAAVGTKDLAPLFSSVLRPALREGGVHLGRVRFDVMPDGSDGIRVTGYAGLRWKLLRASARAEARIQITQDAVITLQHLAVGSRNPLVKFGLLFVRRHLREAVGQSIDLNAQLAAEGAPTRIHGLRVGAGNQLTVSARFS